MIDLAQIFTVVYNSKKLGLVVHSCINVSLYRLNSETLKVPLFKAELCQMKS